MPSASKILTRIGTRGSPLALAQAHMVQALLAARDARQRSGDIAQQSGTHPPPAQALQGLTTAVGCAVTAAGLIENPFAVLGKGHVV